MEDVGEMITVAMDIAARAHAGQKCRFTGEIYLRHPQRVSFLVRNRGGSARAVLGAILHDAVEDGGELFAIEIHKHFGDDMLSLVESLTRRKGESYSIYVRRCAIDVDARLIKECDLDDHLDFDRLHKMLDPEVASAIIEENKGMFAKYEKAKKIIRSYYP